MFGFVKELSWIVGRGSPGVAISVLLRQSTYFAVLGGSVCACLGVMESQPTFSFSRYMFLIGIGVVSASLFVQIAVLFALTVQRRNVKYGDLTRQMLLTRSAQGALF